MPAGIPAEFLKKHADKLIYACEQGCVSKKIVEMELFDAINTFMVLTSDRGYDVAMGFLRKVADEHQTRMDADRIRIRALDDAEFRSAMGLDEDE